MEGKKKFQNVTVKKLPRSEVEIEAEISAEAMEEARAAALAEFMQNAEVPGFRAGRAPENIVSAHVGEMKILERAAVIILDSQYGNIVAEQGLHAIGMPEITITKLAAGNPLGFRAVTAVLPEVSLSGYAAIAGEEFKKESGEIFVDDSEVEKVLENFRKNATTQNPATQGEEKPKQDFENPDFKKKIKEDLFEMKKTQAREKKRLAAAEKLIEKAAIELPEILVTSELDKMIAQFKADIEKSGLTYEGYLGQIKKTEEEVRKEWRVSAEKKAALGLILNHIARTEGLKPDEQKVKQETDHILSHYKDADRFRVRMYVENLFLNEAVFEFLEKQSGR